MSNFKDLFSGHASAYSRFRPTYPGSLFDYLATLPKQTERAWDCGTGNGQAALPLARRFKQVIATDPSQKQLDEAIQDPSIEYKCAPAEAAGISSDSIDLVTVAQALHWFQHDRFFDEVKRVCRKNGAWIAVWSYAIARIDPAVDEVIHHFYTETVGSFWEPERRLVEEGYRSIAFPFAEIQPPTFKMERELTLQELLGYLGTWSATQAASRALNRNVLEELRPELARAWGPAADLPRLVSWPLSLRVGQVS